MQYWKSYFLTFLGKVLVLLLIFSSAVDADEKVIKAWTYYNVPPFVTGKGQGLVYDFVELLNLEAKGSYTFKVIVYPRKRLDAQLDAGKQGVVLFVNWEWMGDGARNKYLWGPAIITDRNEIISRVDQKIEFDGKAESLKGLVFGGLLGRQYAGLMEAMERKDIIRINAGTEEQNIKKLLHKRIDVTTLSKSKLTQHITSMQLEGQLHVSKVPLSSYTRHLLVTRNLKAEFASISELSAGLTENYRWEVILKKYGL